MLSVGIRIISWYFVDLERCCGISSVGLSLACLAWIRFVSVTSSVVSPCLLVPPFLGSLCILLTAWPSCLSTNSLATLCFLSGTAGGEPFIPSKGLEQSRTRCALCSTWCLLVDPQKRSDEKGVQIPVQGAQPSQWVGVPWALGLEPVCDEG